MKNVELPDFSRYVALGDSISSGYTDAALYYDAQQNAFPKLLAQQLQGKQFNFRQALIPADSVGIGFNGNSRLILRKKGDVSNPELGFVSASGDFSVFQGNIFSSNGPFHNLGIPGAKCGSLLEHGYGNPENGVGNYNPFFARISSDAANASVLSDALNLHPSFFTLLVGNNDVLVYAINGGTTDNITSRHDFYLSYSELLLPFLSRQIKGAVANLPDILSIPFFTCIPYNSLLLTTSEAEELSSKHNLNFSAGYNPYPVESENKIRMMERGDVVLYDILFDPLKEEYLKGRIPVPSKYKLTASQVQDIRSAIQSYNADIHAIATEAKLAFVDLYNFLLLAEPDRIYDSATLSLSFATTGIFSLDALHINSLGQALLTNEFIKSINNTYKTFVPAVSLVRYRNSYSVAANK